VRRGAGFWVSAAAGWTVIAWGVRLAWQHHFDTRPADLVRFFVAGAVVHDVVLAPVVLGLGVAVSRFTPGRWRAPVQAALIISGSAALFAWPEIRDYARVNHNPSSLPHNYTANLLVVVAAVGVTTAVVALVQVLRAARKHTG
jgi:hypothetical protein